MVMTTKTVTPKNVDPQIDPKTGAPVPEQIRADTNPEGNDPVELRDTEMQRMRAHFKSQPKVRIKIRKELGEQFVMINGYGFQIQAGEYVHVPEQVAELLQEADII